MYILRTGKNHFDNSFRDKIHIPGSHLFGDLNYPPKITKDQAKEEGHQKQNNLSGHQTGAYVFYK